MGIAKDLEISEWVLLRPLTLLGRPKIEHANGKNCLPNSNPDQYTPINPNPTCAMRSNSCGATTTGSVLYAATILIA